MPLRSETAEILNGFEKRMKFLNIVRILLQYKYPDYIRTIFPDREVLDNIILAVLVYIKDRTLGSQQVCKIKDIADFINEITAILPNSSKIDCVELSKYIVVEVLQNGGVLREFQTFDSKSQTFKPMSVRLVNEEKGCYNLTDDGFDFLYRSKEIESELDYSVARFRLKEYMKRDNYEQALESSRELVSRIRSLKGSMDDFLHRCRENISNIAVDEYEKIISRIRSLLETEYRELEEIEQTASDRKLNMRNTYCHGNIDENTYKYIDDLDEIIRNIEITIEEQRILINKKYSLSRSYEELIKANFTVNSYERLNFKKDIIAKLQRSNEPLKTAAQYLLFPLTKPNIPKMFSVENFYAPQSKIIEEKKEVGINITTENVDQEIEIETRNMRNLKAVRLFFQFLHKKSKFTVNEFVESLSSEDLAELVIENTLPNILLSLYSMQELNIEEWEKSEKFSIKPNGEFELSWCLKELPKELLKMRTVKFIKLSDSINFFIDIEHLRYNFSLSDFITEADYE